MNAIGQPPRSFWRLPAGTPEWMRPPDWMALGSPGKIVGMMRNPRTGKWVMVEAMAGGALGHPGKIVGYNPDTGEVYWATAGMGQVPAAAQEAARRAAEAAAAAARAQAKTETSLLKQQQATFAPQLTPTTAEKAPADATLPILAFGAVAVIGGILLFRRRRPERSSTT